MPDFDLLYNKINIVEEKKEEAKVDIVKQLKFVKKHKEEIKKSLKNEKLSNGFK